MAIPHPEKAAEGHKGLNRKGYGYGGEDAYFYCSNRNGITALGVADGVYMWKDKGIDAGMFSIATPAGRSPARRQGCGHACHTDVPTTHATHKCHFDEADLPEDAMLTTMPVSPGDIVVLGSDGLWDNVSEEELVEEVERDVLEGVKPSVIAQRLAFLAFEHSQDKHKETPYSLGASEAFDMVYSGGKSDDITVMCAVMQ
ncbi:hypothetical protein CHLNCDRAFT_144584 [Chlorella variabilis]|uniref:Protein phosphatase n=1 Tax=Chlorella variabilis TaxID=554065 RepID=E1ZBR6_CHLVA|nr:hypothetical protein CHLNCDRAFT_144584 [Chlorella variabilis]EFN56907.1 hypothetical protein CHLNCDRAFT_144584 [Chlorella variabilis]|eukprot:XP_005849009.1 hypothetical protein CHLNCDRAFT_144584 [Chlorella variabilis]